MKYYRISLKGICFGAITSNDIVINTAPVAIWMIHKPWESCAMYWGNRRAKIEQLFIN